MARTECGEGQWTGGSASQGGKLGQGPGERRNIMGLLNKALGILGGSCLNISLIVNTSELSSGFRK